MINGNQGQNYYPDPDNYPDSSFPQPVPAPSVDPGDADTLITVSYSWHWQPVLLAAADQLLNPATWQGDHDEIITALNRATDLKDLLQKQSVGDIAPWWDENTEDELVGAPPEDGQLWYGIIDPDEDFQANLENVFIGAFVFQLAGAAAAAQFFVLAKAYRLAFRTGDWGGIVDVFVDAANVGTVDTYSAEPGLKYFDVIIPAE